VVAVAMAVAVAATEEDKEPKFKGEKLLEL